MTAALAHRLGHFRMAMQGVRRDDAAFQIQAFQGFERRLDLVAVGAARAGADGDEARGGTEPERLAERLGERRDGFGHLLRERFAKVGLP